MVEGRPEIALGQVENWAAKFGLCGKAGDQGLAKVKEYPSYEDVNFYVKAHDGREFVLKAHNGFVEAGTLARLEAQNRFITRLESQGLPVPSVVKTPEGLSTLSMAEAGACAANQKAHVRVLTYLPGNLAEMESPKSQAMLGNIGSVVGRMTKACKGFEDEDAKWDWEWNMKNVPSACSSKVHYVQDPARRALADRYIESYGQALNAETMAKLPHSVIHSDLNDTNLLFEGESMVGVLDFGDSIYSCTVFDLGIAAGYYSMGQEDPLWVFCEVLRGYLQEADFTEEELAVLYHVCYGRVLLSVCMGAEKIHEEPDNEYLAHTSDPGFAVLKKLEGVSGEEALTRFRQVRDEVRAAAEAKRSRKN